MLEYRLVKKDRLGNLRQREKLCRAGYESTAKRDAVMDACSRDPLLWVNLFCWIFEGRTTRKSGKCLPFITYGYQDDAILNIVNAIQQSNEPEFDADRALLKSRDMGASWLCLTVFTWFWMFEREATFLMLSAKEEQVYKPGNPRALFTKVMYLVDRLPGWMKPEYSLTKMHLVNRDNGSVIDGEATGGLTSVGDRRLAVLLDEFGKIDSSGKEANLAATILRQTSDVTNCRIFNSTPEGMDSGFSVVCANAANVLKLHWSLHPDKRRGMYKVSENGAVEVLDKEWHEAHPEYDFRREPGLADPPFEGLRSPWYDREWDRRLGIKRDIAQELDMQFAGSGDPFFDQGKIAAIRIKHECEPFKSMELSRFLGKNLHDNDPRSGRCRLWYHPLAAFRPPGGAGYTVAVDIASGNGTSDSAVSVANDTTREKVFEFYSNGMTPEVLAEAVYYICRKFTTNRGQPFLIWDMAGPGFPFAKKLLDTFHYGNVFRYRGAGDKPGKRAARPGMPQNTEIKLEMFSEYRNALANEDFITHSAAAYTECLQYIYNSSGAVIHQAANRSAHGSENKNNHGDIAFSEALLVHAMNQRPAVAVVTKPRIPYGSYAWRRRERIRREREEATLFVA